MVEKSKTHLGAGNVEIELEGSPYTLVPSLRACQVLSRASGGLQGVMESIGRLEFDTFHTVISVGLNLRGAEQRDLGERIYRTGLVNLAAPLIDFVVNVSNGGKPMRMGDERSEVDDNEENPQIA